MSRRSLLRTSGMVLAGGTAVVAVGSATTACTLGNTGDTPDPLIALADGARSDADLARRLAATTPERAAALQTIVSERTVHADALDTEIARAAGTTTTPRTPPPGTPASVDPTADAPAPAGGGQAAGGPAGPAHASDPPPPPPTLDAVRQALAAAQRSAAEVARDQKGYRAGLAGSISAACAAEQRVLLR